MALVVVVVACDLAQIVGWQIIDGCHAGDTQGVFLCAAAGSIDIRDK